MSGARILVVEDDPRISASVALYMRHAGYEVREVTDGLAALDTAASFAPHLVVLDVMLPGLDGFEVCRSLRAVSAVPIIMLTARAGEEHTIRGLDLGADDYVTKPFSPRELAARVATVLRRAAPAAQVVRCGDLEVDLSRRQLRRGRAIVDVTAAEFRLIEALASSPGRTFTRQELADRAFGLDRDVLDRTIDVHIMNLRRKLEPQRAGRPEIIVTVYGIGYRLGQRPHDA